MKRNPINKVRNRIGNAGLAPKLAPRIISHISKITTGAASKM